VRLLAVFTLVALAEMATFFWVESRTGLGWALGIAVLTAVVGSALVRRAGLSVLSDIQRKMASAELPGRELTHGVAVLVAGAFLISPGFITDALGFLLLVPAVRDLTHRVVSARLAGRVGFVGFGTTSGDRPVDPPVIDVESWE